MKKSLVLILSIFVLITVSVAQSFREQIVDAYNDYYYYNVEEYAYIDSNDDVYFAGGVLDFAVVVFDQFLSASSLSKILHVELIHENALFHERFSYRMDSGTVNGHINLPNEIPSGNYQLVAYTNFMKNGDLEFSSHRIQVFIQNPLDKNSIEARRPKSKLLDNNSSLTGDLEWINISREGSFYKLVLDRDYIKKTSLLVSEGLRSLQFIETVDRRKRVMKIPEDLFRSSFQRLLLISEDMEVLAVKNFIVDNNMEFLESSDSLKNTVKSTDSFPRGSLYSRLFDLFFKIHTNENLEEATFKASNSTNALANWTKILEGLKRGEFKFLAERNLTLSGIINADFDLQGHELAIHFFGNDVNILAPLDGERFSIELFAPTGKDHIYFTLIDDLGTEVFSSYSIDFNPQLNFEYDHFYLEGQDLVDQNVPLQEFQYVLSTFNEVSDAEFNNSHKVDEEYFVDDYQGLNSMEDFLREVSSKTVIKGSEENMSLRLYNPDAKRLHASEPLVIWNNIPIKGSNKLLDYPLKDISSVAFLYRPSTLARYGISFRNGVVFVETKDQQSPMEVEYHERFKAVYTYATEAIENHVAKKFSPTIRVNKSSTDSFSIEKSGNNYHHKETLNSRGKLHSKYN